MDTNVLKHVVTDSNFDPFESASTPVIFNYDLFGLVEINAWACALIKGSGKVPFDQTNPDHKRLTAIDVFIQPLAEIDVKYPKTWECDWVAEFATWARITLPSIKAAGFDNVREINDKWARVARVDSLDKPFEKKDAAGNLTGEKAIKKTFKFVEFYDTEDACRAAYLANGGQVAAPVTTTPADPADADKQTAMAFLKVIVETAARGKDTQEQARVAITLALAGYPTVNKYFTAESPEVLAMLDKLNLSPF